MVKVGITGCDNLRAAELVRVLINHPDVELKWVCGAGMIGSRLDQVVPGIVGECDLELEAAGRLDEVDVVFTCEPLGQASMSDDITTLPEGLKIIDLSGRHNLDHGVVLPWKYGLSEMQRRVLVHDTQYITVPGIAATASLLTLMPIARNQKLNNPLAIHVEMGTMAFPCEGKTIDGMDLIQWTETQRREIEMVLGQCQSSVNQPVVLTIVDRPVVAADVENTNKCLINIVNNGLAGEFTVHAVMDLLLKGSAGNAVHAMNLMFGLHERVGLALKGTGC